MFREPLEWPNHIPRTSRPEQSRFKARNRSYFAAGRELQAEVGRLGDSNPVITVSLRLRQDGLPYAVQRPPEDPGVAVYFVMGGKQRCMACDRWLYIQENLHAVTLTIQALRGIERWGSSAMVQSAFQGFQALPAPDGDPRAVLNVGPNASWEVIVKAYKAQRFEHHPDRGGDPEKFIQVQEAFERLEKELK